MSLNREFVRAFRPLLDGSTRSYATVLMAGLIKTYGIDVLGFEAETIAMDVKADFDVDMPASVADQIGAAQAILASDAVYESVATFDSVVNALNREDPQTTDEIPSVFEVAWAVQELAILDPEPVGRDPENPFDATIAAYCGVVLQDEGFKSKPKQLFFAKLKKRRSEFVEDPDLYAAAHTSQDASAHEIEATCEEEMNRLAEQLASIGLQATDDQ